MLRALRRRGAPQKGMVWKRQQHARRVQEAEKAATVDRREAAATQHVAARHSKRNSAVQYSESEAGSESSGRR